MAREVRKHWLQNSKSLFERFAAGIQQYSKDGSIPADGDQDIRYGLELQRQRLEEKHIDMEYEFIPRGHFADEEIIGRKWKDDKYKSVMTCRTCRMEREYFRENKRIFRHKENKMFYQTITDIHNHERAAEDAYCCPDCAAITKISELEKGCPYCGARFKISDIFPKVTTYYYVLDDSMTQEELKSGVSKYILVLGMLIFLFGFASEFFGSGEYAGNLLMSLLEAVFAGVLGGVVLGAVAYMIVHIGGSIVINARRSIPMMPAIGSGWKFISQMKKYSPEFSYEYFSNKIVSLVKMIMFSDAPDELPVYSGEMLGSAYADVVDLSYAGMVGLKKFRTEGDDCLVTLHVFMDVVRDKGNRLSEKREKLVVEAKKNIKAPVDLGFSIRHLKCQGCSMSFDATKEKCCPSCGTAYDVSQQDWVITQIRKK